MTYSFSILQKKKKKKTQKLNLFALSRHLNNWVSILLNCFLSSIQFNIGEGINSVRLYFVFHCIVLRAKKRKCSRSYTSYGWKIKFFSDYSLLIETTFSLSSLVSFIPIKMNRFTSITLFSPPCSCMIPDFKCHTRWRFDMQACVKANDIHLVTTWNDLLQ